MGGYGITEDCPGFLASKWMDAQLEATYEGPEAVQRRQLTVTMTSEVFLAQFRTSGLRRCDAVAATHPGTGACTLASAMQMWLWTLEHLQKATDADGQQALSRTAAGRDVPAGGCAVLAAGIAAPDSGCAGAGAAWSSRSAWQMDWQALCNSSVICATCRRRRPREKFRGSARSWCSATTSIQPGTMNGCSMCFTAEELDELEETMPGIAAMAIDVIGQ